MCKLPRISHSGIAAVVH